MLDSPWISGLVGGLLIGLASGLLLLGNGRIAGVSGILRGFVGLALDREWLERAGFVACLLAAPVVFADQFGRPALETPFGPVVMAAGGFIVGIGVRFANGCTSGHGVCGLARLSRRSIAATATFMVATAATVFVVRHVVGF